MSLKALHIVFVIASILVCGMFSYWGFWQYFREEGSRAHLIYGISGVLAVLALAWYGQYVLKKLKNISYL